MISDMENVIAVSSTGEDRIIFLDRNNYEIIEEYKLLVPSSTKYNSQNYFGPHGLVFDKNRKYMYVANSYNGSISIIDLLKWNLIENICVGTSPCHMDISKKNNFLYVANFDSDTVSGIDLKKNSVAVQIPVNRMPHDLHMSNDGKNLYVAGLGSEEIFVIDTENNSVCDKIVLNCCAMHFKISRCNKYLVASCSNFNCENQGILCIVDISQKKVVERIKIGIYLADLALRDTTKEIFVLDAETNYIYKLNVNDGKMIGKAETGKFPSCIGMDEEKNIAITGNHLDNTIEIFDLDDLKKIKRIRVGKDLSCIYTL